MSDSDHPQDLMVGVDPPPRSQARALVGALIITVATAQVLGITIRTPSMLEVNDISRWCTIWALVERGTYAIDECPWQHRTQDKVLKPDKLEAPGEGASSLKRMEYALAPRAWKTGEVRERYYSSKPPLLPTLIAGMIYPFRVLSGVPLESMRKQPRADRNIEERVEVEPGRFETRRRTETNRPPVEFPAYVYYFKPILITWNVVPFLITLLLYRRLLDRHARNDWAWYYCLFAGAWGTYLFAFDQTLNNHTVAAASAFLAFYALTRILADGQSDWRYYACAGFFAAFTACNEIPAALFGLLTFLVVLARDPRKTFLGFVPAAIVPLAAFFVTQFLAFKQFTPVYEEFGTRSYNFEGSYWNTPLEFDYFNVAPEPRLVYLFHMTLGHHGLISLTPIVLLGLWGAIRLLGEPGRRFRTLAALSLVLTIAMLAFYTWNPKARNYGGSTQGLRWLFWLFPLWLFTLPRGVEAGEERRLFRGFTLALLAVSTASVAYALRFPWSHPWLVDLLVRLGLYQLRY